MYVAKKVNALLTQHKTQQNQSPLNMDYGSKKVQFTGRTHDKVAA